jgi:hypothetical protein
VNPLAIGLVFGLGAVFQVIASPDIMPGIRGDLRHVTIAVAAAWGGPVAGGTALLMALLARASVGSWDAAPLALASASFALAMGLVARRFEILQSRRGRLAWGVLSAFLPVSAARWIGHLTSSTVVAPVTAWIVLSLVPIATLMATMLVALLRRLDAHAAAERALHDAQNAQRLALGAGGHGFPHQLGQGQRVLRAAAGQRCRQHARAFAVGQVQAAHIGFVKTMGDKASCRLLVVGGDMAHHQTAHGAQFAHHRRGRDQITQAQPMRQCLRQTTQVQHAPCRIQAFERRGRFTGEIELAFMVVFEQHDVVLLRSLQ